MTSRVGIHTPFLLPKAKAEEVISKHNIGVLKQATGITCEREHTLGVNNKSILHLNKTVSKMKECIE